MKRRFLKPLAIACGAAILFLNVTIVMNNKPDSNFIISAGTPAMAQQSSSSSSGSSSSGSSSSSTSTGMQTASKKTTASVTYYWDVTAGIWILGSKGSITKVVIEEVTFQCCMAGQGSCAAPTPDC